MYPCMVARSSAVVLHNSVLSKSIRKVIASADGGGPTIGNGLSIFTVCVITGIVMIKMMGSINMTSIKRGHVDIGIGPNLIAVCSHGHGALLGLADN